MGALLQQKERFGVRKSFWLFQLCPEKWSGAESTRVQEETSIPAVPTCSSEAKDTVRRCDEEGEGDSPSYPC